MKTWNKSKNLVKKTRLSHLIITEPLNVLWFIRITLIPYTLIMRKKSCADAQNVHIWEPRPCCGFDPPLLCLIICISLWSGVINCQLSLDPDVRVHLGKMNSGMLNIAHVLCTKQTLHWLITPGLHPSSVNNGSIPLASICCPCVSVSPESLLFVMITVPERES